MQRKAVDAKQHAQALVLSGLHAVITVVAAVLLGVITRATAVPHVFDWLAAFR